ncbi:unnamed protein product [Ixodes persulcatus]
MVHNKLSYRYSTKIHSDFHVGVHNHARRSQLGSKAPKVLICNLKHSSKMCLRNAGNHQCSISSRSSFLLMDTQFRQTCLFSATPRISCNFQQLSYYPFSHQIPYGDKTVRNGTLNVCSFV